MAKKKNTKKERKTKSQMTYEWLVAKGREFAADLRKKATIHEKQFYKILKDLHYKFEFQVPIITGRKHLYIADFVINNLILEINGSQHYTPEGIKKDRLRARRLKREGYHVLNLTNKQVGTFSKEQIKQLIETKISLINLENC